MNRLADKVLLSISAILGVTLLVSGVLLKLQMNTTLGVEVEKVEVEKEQPYSPVEQRPIDELPDTDGYVLHRSATAHQIELFEILVYAHDQFYETASDEDLESYAAAIVRNFVADFFTLSNKESRSDVGGLQFFSENLVDNFKSFAIDDYYLYLNHFIDKFGSDLLPTVDSTTVINTEFSSQIVEKENEEADDPFEVEPVTPYEPIIYDEGNISSEEATLGEEVRTIIVDVEWSYATTTLPYIDDFQTSARFVLVISEEDVKIYAIQLI